MGARCEKPPDNRSYSCRFEGFHPPGQVANSTQGIGACPETDGDG